MRSVRLATCALRRGDDPQTRQPLERQKNRWRCLMKQINYTSICKRLVKPHLLAACPDLGGNLKLLNVQRSLQLDPEILLEDEEQERLIYHFTEFTVLSAACSCFDPSPATVLLATGRRLGTVVPLWCNGKVWHAVPTLMANLRHVARTNGMQPNK